MASAGSLSLGTGTKRSAGPESNPKLADKRLSPATTSPPKRNDVLSMSPRSRLQVSPRMATTENFEKRANLRPRFQALESSVNTVLWICTGVDLELPGVGSTAAGTEEATDEKPPKVSPDWDFCR